MKRGRSIPNQMQIDFLAAFRRMLVSLGTAENLLVNESMFMKLTDHWEATQVMPADLLFQKSPIEAVVFRLQKDDQESGANRLKFPATLMAGELRGTPGLTGFSALFREQGWVVLPAELPGMYKNLFLNILAASIGLEAEPLSRTELLAEAERVALASLLPEAEVRKFFGIKLSRFPDSFRLEVANYYNLPFEYVLKRAYHLGLISGVALEEASTEHKPARPNPLRKPVSSRAA